MNKIPKYLRISVSVVILLLITLYLVCDNTVWEQAGSWIAEIQIFPAALCLSSGILVLWIVITLLFGRIYCSSICPLGTLQDIIARLSNMISRTKPHYRYSSPFNKTRIITLIALIAALLLGATIITSFLDPYTLYRRFAGEVIRPLYSLGRIGAVSVLGVTIALVPILIISAVASRHGRTFCNTLCPVGTALGAISRNSLYHFDINTDKCINCRKCEDECKASCINLTDHVVDGSRCVNCFNCTGVCPNDAITYTTRRHRLSTPLMQRIKENITLDNPQPAMDYDAPANPDIDSTHNTIENDETIS